MQRDLRICLYIILCVCCAGGVQAGGRRDALRALDDVIRRRAAFQADKERTIDSLRRRLYSAHTDAARFDLYSRLYEAYVAYQTDSALKLIHEKERLLPRLAEPRFRIDARLNRAGALTIAGMYKEALEVLQETTRSDIPPDLLQAYFHHFRTLYGHMAGYALTPDERREYLLRADRYRDSLLSVIPPADVNHRIIRADQLIARGRPAEAARLLQPVADTCSQSTVMRFLAYTLADAYGRLGDRERQKRYLALSAEADLRLSVREYISLRQLAFLLYEDGDIDRAYDYMKCALEDAGACNARARIVEAAEIYPVIDRAYRIRSDRKQRTIVGLLLGSVLLAASLVLSLLHVYRQMQRLRQARRALSDANARLQTANDALSDVNRTLLEANAIKEEYIAQYINRCSVYIDKLDHYRRRLMKLAQSGRTDELLRTVRSTELIADERREFYAEFDRTFLGLFPHFVEEFNALLHPADRITPKAGERLTTELRIFALIRLGITDSARIAEFLGYSVTTIYNYRSKTRGKSTLDRDAFESAVMRIG